MIQTTSRQRMERASKSKTRKASERLDLKRGDLVDIWRDPATKDLSGWRGPGTVIDSPSGNAVDVRWQGRVLSCRIQDIRKSLQYAVYLGGESATFQDVQRHTEKLDNNSQVVSFVKGPTGAWTKSRHARDNPKRSPRTCTSAPRAQHSSRVGKG